MARGGESFVICNVIQNTESWLKWRCGGIGASDAPIIMGVSPWTTAAELIRIKAGILPGRAPNTAMLRGKRMEAEARKSYQKRAGVDVEPVCLESNPDRWMKASLDGINFSHGRVVEIKCPGAVDHSAAVAGNVPEKYYPQLQHILAVTGYSHIDYWSYRFDSGVLIKVERDESYISRLRRFEGEFWNRLRYLREKVFGSRKLLRKS
ncbi:MAG: YqaJ viral recombinase family protein [Planctomycetes bacterium]|nr:YqaJ viral recombinase family protein [Planctomycetota bacterium]